MLPDLRFSEIIFGMDCSEHPLIFIFRPDIEHSHLAHLLGGIAVELKDRIIHEQKFQ